MRCLVWFRSDLRTIDNCALHCATKLATRGVLAIFVIAPAQWTRHDYAPAKVDLILRSLRCLREELARLNIPLVIRHAPTPEAVPELVAREAATHGCDAVHFNKEYELDESRRDARTIDLCDRQGTRAFAWTDQTLLEPGTVRTQAGSFYTVFSPFQRAALAALQEQGGVREWPLAKKQHAMIAIDPAASRIPDRVSGFESRIPAETWPAGEAHALARLRAFAERSIISYKDRRDSPALQGTSQLSPALTVGSLSPRQCLAAALQADAASHKNGTSQSRLQTPGVAQWISELLWREFYVHILVGFPRVCMHRAFQPATERIRWNTNDAHLEAWQQGMTGFPIIDAGMRQLLCTGWMHNRVRMIVAMFFTKNLFLDWRHGERWFMRHLVDGFFASNNGGWQWSASTGTDAAPYFRVFNPISQSTKFDAQGTYIREFVPELRELRDEAIHEPWTLPGLQRSRLQYPEPIVDLSTTRQHAIAAFSRIKQTPTGV